LILSLRGRVRFWPRLWNMPCNCWVISSMPGGAAIAPGAPDGHTLDVGAYLKMAVLLDGILDPRRVNPVNAQAAAP